MPVITVAELFASFRKGLRNEHWKRLDILDTTLFGASLCYVKLRRFIVDAKLIEKLLALVEKLMEMKGMVPLKKGFKKAVELLEKREEGGGIHMGTSVETLAARFRLHLLDQYDRMKVKDMQEVIECRIIH